MLYLNGDRAYRVSDDGSVHGVDVRGHDKVVTIREPGGVTVSDVATVKELPAGAVPVTVDELVAKFGISEGHPLTYRKQKA